MFKLTDNKLIEEGYCKYEDNFGNKLFIKKEDLSFTAKLRFKREGITAYPLKISYPPKNGETGLDFKYDYVKGTDLNAEDVQSGLKSFSLMCQHWFDMMNIISMLSLNDEIIAKSLGIPPEQKDAISQYKLRKLAESPELVKQLNSVF